MTSQTKAKNKVVENWQVLKVAWPWLAWVGFTMALAGWAVGLVYYISNEYGVYGGPSNSLVDMGYELIPELTSDVASWLLFSAVVYAVALSIFFSIKGYIEAPLIAILWRTGMIMAISFSTRSIAFLVTILPSASPSCRRYPRFPGDQVFDPPGGFLDIFLFKTAIRGCGDLIFSGHMTCVIIAALVVTHYSPRKLFSIPSWMIVISEAFMILAQRLHYSVDVFLALVIVPQVWICFYHFFPRDINKRVLFWKEQPAFNNANM